MGVEAADEPDAAPGPEDIEDVLGTDEYAFVDELNAAIGELVEDADGLRYVYVVGDVSDPGESSAGHLHFDLVNEGSTVHCVRFGWQRESAEPDVEDGTLVAVKGDLSYYESEGQVSLIVGHVVEVGVGRYRQIYRRNRRLLEDDGLLAEEAKQPLPTFPKCVGIVTSASSDAREDAVTSIHGRHQGVDVVVADATVQGEDAMASMMRAVSRLDDDARVDVIVITRGGGADKHLRVFNETPLCRVVHHAATPVVVGVGHENDRSLAGEVADHRVMTPTEVGEIVPQENELAEMLTTAAERLDATFSRTVMARLEALGDDLRTAFEGRVGGGLAALTGDLDHAFETVAAQRLTSYDNRLDHALQTAEHRKRYEQERARDRRRQRIVVAVLVAALLVLLGYIILTGS